MSKRLWAGAALALALTVATGCSTSITGSPQPGLTPVELRNLKTGALATEPSDYQLHLSDGKKDVRLIEARRMLNYLVHPFDVDSDLTDIGYTKLMADPYSMTADGALPEFYKPVTDKYDLIAGAYVSRTNGSLRSMKRLIMAILRFPTAADSTGAAAEFDRITREQRERHDIQITGYPDARASSPDDLTVTAFQSHGPYLILTNAALPQPNRDGLADRVKKAIDLQIAQLDRQQPIPLDDVLDLPIDPDGIMRRAAPRAKDFSDPFFGIADFGPYQPSGILHFQRNPIEVRKAMEDSGVDLVGRRAGTVYRTRDLAGAFRLQTALTKPGKDDEIVDPPPGLPDVRCLRLNATDSNRLFNSFCAIVYGRYVAVVESSTPSTTRVDLRLQERAAAQYSILAKSE
ncbi:DUF7373 family lipoprotein [Nocardia pseudovaccinii]|uniref:DUF7373 family lipoprotein n=1 Tax=Nocardia pseudovaccinii TaxID=189540 RepID=UPI0007C7DE25|nr:hypothetical protein [Nocardia pseudovaccinii]